MIDTFRWGLEQRREIDALEFTRRGEQVVLGARGSNIGPAEEPLGQIFNVFTLRDARIVRIDDYRTDRGVFSMQAEAILNHSRGFRTLAGRAAAIEAGDRQVVVTIEYDDQRERVAYDLVVVAIGFDARWFEALLGHDARRRLDDAAGAELERRIGLDLSIAGLSPPLHLPVLAGLAQGPGFPNLSCLGLLSDRILRRYVPLEEPARRIASERRELV